MHAVYFLYAGICLLIIAAIFGLRNRQTLRDMVDQDIKNLNRLRQITEARLEAEQRAIKDRENCRLTIESVISRQFELQKKAVEDGTVKQANKLISQNQSVLGAAQDEKVRFEIIQTEASAVEKQTRKFDEATLKKQQKPSKRKTFRAVKNLGTKGIKR
jgi:hypothetical protein